MLCSPKTLFWGEAIKKVIRRGSSPTTLPAMVVVVFATLFAQCIPRSTYGWSVTQLFFWSILWSILWSLGFLYLLALFWKWVSEILNGGQQNIIINQNLKGEKQVKTLLMLPHWTIPLLMYKRTKHLILRTLGFYDEGKVHQLSPKKSNPKAPFRLISWVESHI